MSAKTFYSLGLIGYPLEHSLSPKLHTAALADTNLDGEYKLYPIPADKYLEDRLSKILDEIKKGQIAGLNVTIPYKTTVITHLDELTDTADQTGAVNTIFLDQNKLIGDNSDVSGFLKDLNNFFNSIPDASDPRCLKQRYALTLGSGGAARAVVYGLIKEDWQVTLAARNVEKSKEIAHRINQFWGNRVVKSIKLTVEEINSLKHPVHLLVNATSAGMWPDVDSSPWFNERDLPAKALVYDLVYNPGVTRLVKLANQQNLYATSGLGMLVEQAALAFEKWTGKSPSIEFMRQSIEIEKRRCK